MPTPDAAIAAGNTPAALAQPIRSLVALRLTVNNLLEHYI